MAERIVSPGVFTREKDLSFLPQGIDGIGAALIGPTEEGPAFTPTIVRNFAEFEQMFGKESQDFYEGKTTLPLIIIFQRANREERDFLLEILKKENRNEEDFSETLSLINKYKAVEASFKRAEYFVNVSYDSLGIFQHSEEKKILQNLTGFSLNRSF